MKINKNYFIKVPNEFLGRGKEDNLKMSSMAVTLYMLFYKDLNIRGLCKLNVKELMDLTGIKSTGTRQINQIKDSLEELHRLGIFKYNKDIKSVPIGQNIYAELLIRIDEDFTILYDDELYCILNYCKDKKIRKYDLIRVYTYLLSYIYENDRADSKYSYFTYDKVIRDLHKSSLEISENTIISYKEIYNELELIYVNTNGYKIIEGNYRNEPSCHCRYEYKDILENIINQNTKDNRIKILNDNNKEKGNKKRSIKSQINNLMKKRNKTNEDNIRLKELEEKYIKLAR